IHQTINSMYSDSEFKFPCYKISEEFAGFNRYPRILQWSNGHCDCSSCPIRSDYYRNSIYSFFSDRRREQYQDLNSVFRWLDNLHIDFFDDENPRYILEKGHMSKQFKQNLEYFEKSLNACNSYIQTANVAINSSINEIIKRPVYVKLTNEQESSIYRFKVVNTFFVFRSPIIHRPKFWTLIHRVFGIGTS